MSFECIVLRSEKRLGAYVYVRDKAALSKLPAPLASALGQLTETLRFQLSPTRKLARADAGVVIANIEKLGYHVQFPPSEYLGDTER